MLFFMYLAFWGFVIYLLVTVLQFMKTKTHNDEKLIQKLDELTELMKKQSRR
ncbi:hypothetical protein [Pseudalkalibacillus caeni]|uniref:hypothetical protein n=1 Tax=Exobacillus caeni TaxID=2574798 RepID=UPI0014852899|nr:hypothetical protein [Pseudalkalibacillus caeni]